VSAGLQALIVGAVFVVVIGGVSVAVWMAGLFDDFDADDYVLPKGPIRQADVEPDPRSEGTER